MLVHPTVPVSVTEPSFNAESPMAGRRLHWARAYRNGELICGRVDLMIRPDTRLGLAPRERRQLTARFVEHVCPLFRHELEQLVRRRGAAATRIRDRIETIELVLEEPQRDCRRLVGRLEAPQSRRWELSENEFVIREHL